jgi:hypothetical protein
MDWKMLCTRYIFTFHLSHVAAGFRAICTVSTKSAATARENLLAFDIVIERVAEQRKLFSPPFYGSFHKLWSLSRDLPRHDPTQFDVEDGLS